MSRPRLLDLFCGAGGAAMGYHRAGFDVVGVDNRPQPRYPFDVVQADAMDCINNFCNHFALSDFRAIHASPPCQAYSQITKTQGDPAGHPDLLAPTRDALKALGLPWVIENVPRAPMRPDYRLCGCMFGLGVKRERWFETSWRGFDLRPPCRHLVPAIGVYGYGGPRGSSGRFSGRLDKWREAMGIDWMDHGEQLAQAIPPAYTEHIGRALLGHLKERAA